MMMATIDNISRSNNIGICDDVDEDQSTSMPVPLVITKFHQRVEGIENSDNDSDTVSSLSSDDEPTEESSSSSSNTPITSPAAASADSVCGGSSSKAVVVVDDEEQPRLLFPKYWTKTGEESPQRSKKRLSVVVPSERSSSPQCVMRMMNNNDRTNDPTAADPHYNDVDDDGRTSSSSSYHQEQQQEQPDQADSRPRSLFSTYWTKTGEVAPSLPRRQQVSSSSPYPCRPASPQCVRDSLFPDPFAVFGLLEEDSSSEDDDEFSTNTYERMISHYDVTPRKTKQRNSKTRRPYESKPLFWRTWFTTTSSGATDSSTPKFTASAPSLLLSRRSGGLLSSMTSSSLEAAAAGTPGFGSAPALQTKPLPSALRKGRFSRSSVRSSRSTTKYVGATFSDNNNNSSAAATTTTTNTTATPPNQEDRRRRSVHFQPQVQIQSYELPVESWAADGWSSWFGV